MELMVFEKPVLPADWNYGESVKKTKQTIYKLKNITKDVAMDLWTAREMLSSRYHRDGTNIPSWNQYCTDIGVSKRTANRWLNRWFSIDKLEEAQKAS